MTNQEIVSKAKEYLRGNLGTGILMGFIIAAIGSAVQYVLGLGSGSSALLTAGLMPNGDAVTMNEGALWGYGLTMGLSGIVAGIISQLFEIGHTWSYIDLLDTGRLQIEGIFQGFKVQPLRSLLYSIIYGILTSIGFFLFFIPGVIMTFGYALAPFILRDDQEISAWDAMKESWRLMKGNKMRLFTLVIRIFLPIVFLYVALIAAFLYLINTITTESFGAIPLAAIVLFLIGLAILVFGLILAPRYRAAMAIFYRSITGTYEEVDWATNDYLYGDSYYDDEDDDDDDDDFFDDYQESPIVTDYQKIVEEHYNNVEDTTPVDAPPTDLASNNRGSNADQSQSGEYFQE